MARAYAQKTKDILGGSGRTLDASASISGSVMAVGYSKLVGLFWSDASLLAACGLRVDWSSDYGNNWDYTSASDTVASGTATACFIDVIGNAVRVSIQNGVDEASNLRAHFYLRPE